MDKSQKKSLPANEADAPQHKIPKIEVKENESKEETEIVTGNSDKFATDWSVDKYRLDHERDEQWELKRRFMMEHKNKFSEDRLVCLAQSFINVEMLGCVYGAETMQLIGELSKDVVKEYREKRATRLKPTFETPSNAAKQYAKRRCM